MDYSTTVLGAELCTSPHEHSTCKIHAKQKISFIYKTKQNKILL